MNEVRLIITLIASYSISRRNALLSDRDGINFTNRVVYNNIIHLGSVIVPPFFEGHEIEQYRSLPSPIVGSCSFVIVSPVGDDDVY